MRRGGGGSSHGGAALRTYVQHRPRTLSLANCFALLLYTSYWLLLLLLLLLLRKRPRCFAQQDLGHSEAFVCVCVSEPVASARERAIAHAHSLEDSLRPSSPRRPATRSTFIHPCVQPWTTNRHTHTHRETKTTYTAHTYTELELRKRWMSVNLHGYEERCGWIALPGSGVVDARGVRKWWWWWF